MKRNINVFGRSRIALLAIYFEPASILSAAGLGSRIYQRMHLFILGVKAMFRVRRFDDVQYKVPFLLTSLN